MPSSLEESGTRPVDELFDCCGEPSPSPAEARRFRLYASNTPRRHLPSQLLALQGPPDTSVSNMVIPANLPHMELQLQTEVWQPIGRWLFFQVSHGYEGSHCPRPARSTDRVTHCMAQTVQSGRVHAGSLGEPY